MGIRSKLVLCLLAVVAPLAAVGAFAIHVVDLQMTERTVAALANTQRLEAARVEQILDGYASDARALAGDTALRTHIARLEAYRADQSSGLEPDNHAPIQLPSSGGYPQYAFLNLAAVNPLQRVAVALQNKAAFMGSSIAELKLLDAQGSPVGQTAGFSWMPANADIVQRSLSEATTLFGDAFRNADDQSRLGIVTPILSEAGDVIGALVLETGFEPIIDLIAKHESVGESVEAHIVQPTQQGGAQLITPLRFERTAAFSKVIPKESGKPAVRALSSPESQVIKSIDYRGVESYVAFQTLKNTGWGLVIKIDAAETYAPVTRLRRWLALATVASIGFVALIYLFFLVPVVRRLNRAAKAARQIRDGNLSVRLRDEKNDEITELASSINCLARDLATDQKKRSEVETQLRFQAAHDELTGLMNRKHAKKVIQKLNSDTDKAHSVMFLDLDGFKDINDLYGHAAGDDVLKCISDRLTQQIPPQSTLARWGGDEFVVILPDTSERQAAESSRLLQSIFDNPVNSREGQHRVGCSIGLATSGKNKPLDKALLEADAQMYEEKNRQRLRHSRAGMNLLGVTRALMEHRMEMWFQPMVRLERPGSYVLFGADTSIRMRSSLGGYVLSEEFMRDVHDPSVIRELDERRLQLSLGALRRWTCAGIVNREFRLCMHLSQQTLNDDTFPTMLQAQLRDLEILPVQIQLQFSCSAAELSSSVFEQLSNMGVTVAITATSSATFVPEQVSNPQRFTAIISKTCLDDSAGLPPLIERYHALQVDVIATEVEDREQLARLHELGVKQFQGSLFEPPMNGVEFVSRCGQSLLTGLGTMMSPADGLRLTG